MAVRFQEPEPLFVSCDLPRSAEVFPPNLGFCRLALKHGIDLLPIYAFGGPGKRGADALRVNFRPRHHDVSKSGRNRKEYINVRD